MPDTAPPPPEADLEAIDEGFSIEPRTVFLGALLLLAALAACYAAAEIVLPIVLAFVLSAVLRPLFRALRQLGLPAFAAAILIVLSLLSLMVAIGMLLSAPLSDWISRLPHTLPRLQERLRWLSAPLRSLQDAAAHVQKLAPVGGEPALSVKTTTMAERLLGEARYVAGEAFTTMLVLFFVLMSGETFLRRLVEVLPRFKDKRQAVAISQQIEQDISIYLATITMMNGLVGVGVALTSWACGLGDPLLWGIIAFLLNYVPILGPTAGVVLFLVVGLVTIDPLWAAFLPAALYLLIHMAEGETITPLLLARRFTVNPVLIVLGVVFWYWLWGIAGAVLATPMLAILKIVCDRIERLRPIGHLIGG
jgi:predicted PurR-regulated permease PerM